jgi:CheY-like chemotaxis protein
LTPRVCAIAAIRDVAVLVVDDNATNRHLLEGMLLGWRMAPTPAASVPDALALLRAARRSERPFALVSADSHMPDGGGCGLAGPSRRIRRSQTRPS